jgi:hypothetical protein
VLFDGEIVADGKPFDVLQDKQKINQWRLVATSLLELNFQLYSKTGKFLRAEALAQLLD